jgi:hypothetical protein
MKARIITNYDASRPHFALWAAVTSDYDGAPDTKPPFSCIGLGETEAEAIADLEEQLAECRE